MVAIATWLGAQVGLMRARTGISILHGDNMELADKIRRHANFTENAPLALILLAILELNGAGPVLLHALGIGLVAARIAHPLGLHHDNIQNPLRAIGSGGTTLILLVAAGAALWQAIA
jgi:uncharacterized membrane protein YecN with MAPEG domain